MYFDASLSAATSILLLQPLEVWKTRRQEMVTGSRPLSFKKIPWFSGSAAALIRGVPAASMYLCGLETIKDSLSLLSMEYMPVLQNKTNTKTPFLVSSLKYVWNAENDKFTSRGLLIFPGLLRGGLAVIFHPIYVLKTLQETNKASSTTTLNLIRMIVKENAYWRGLGSVLMRDVPSASLYYMFYQKILSFSSSASSSKTGQTTISVTMASAALASSLATVLTHPFDVYRMRKQTSLINLTSWKGQNIFTVGLLPRLLKKGIGASLTWGLWEYFLEKKNK